VSLGSSGAVAETADLVACQKASAGQDRGRAMPASFWGSSDGL